MGRPRPESLSRDHAGTGARAATAARHRSCAGHGAAFPDPPFRRVFCCTAHLLETDNDMKLLASLIGGPIVDAVTDVIKTRITKEMTEAEVSAEVAGAEVPGIVSLTGARAAPRVAAAGRRPAARWAARGASTAWGSLASWVALLTRSTTVTVARCGPRSARLASPCRIARQRSCSPSAS